jgi:hypothetical protein
MSIGMQLRKVYSFLRDTRRTVNAVRNAKEMAKAPSYYPELQQKSFRQKEKENIIWAGKYGEVNDYYTLYGFDIVGLRNQEEYIDFYSFMTSRNRVNRLGQVISYNILLRDKLLFYKHMKSNDLPVADVFAVITNGVLSDLSLNPVPWETIIHEQDYFIKVIDGQCASFVKHIGRFSDLERWKPLILGGGQSYILQRRIIQDDRMGVINPNALNTLRIVTVNKDGNPYVLSSVLRVGTSKTENVDNWSAGGLAIGIKENGFLKKYGFYNPAYGIKAEAHPDTKIVFSEFRIPMYKEALELACKAHRCFCGIRAIGWDIAISDSGLVFVEGNDNFGICVHQACDRPLRKEWAEACN